MNTMSERFEMRLEPELLSRIEEWREKQGDQPSRAEAIRRLVESGLSRQASNFRPNASEKMIIWMLSELMKSQKAGDAKSLELIQEAVFGGHFWAIDWEFPSIIHNHQDADKSVSFVLDTLEMWSCIEDDFAALSSEEKERIKEKAAYSSDPKFPGFDGNNETELMGIGRLLTQKLGRFERYKDHSFNAHHPTRSMHGNMLSKFRKIRSDYVGRRMNAEELERLLNI